MSKAHRGKGILDKPKRGRGTCPVSKQTGVKLMYEVEIEGKKAMISKVGKAILANAKKAAPKAAKPAEAQEAAASGT